jgi:hypothetical protein
LAAASTVSWLQALGAKRRGGAITLHRTLGAWTRRETCEWFFDATSERLLHSCTGKIYIRRKGRTTRDSHMHFEGSNVQDASFSTQRVATVVLLGNKMESFGHLVTPDIAAPASFREYVLRNKQWEWWSGQLTYQEDEIRQVALDIREGRGIAVSDGSYKDNYGTAAVIVEGNKSGRSIRTVVIIPGPASIQCAYRSEAAGILAAVQLVEAVVSFYELPYGRCTLGCDGQAALRQSFYKSVGVQVNIPHYDIIGTTRQTTQLSRLQWTYKHIPGHQTILPLDREAAMNDDMDQSCKRYWESSRGETPTWFKNTWSVWIKGERLVSDLSASIREFCIIARQKGIGN